MEAIGGYFGLADHEEGMFPHQGGIFLNTGRNALEYILRSIGDVKRVYLPYYTCEVVLEPLKKLYIPWTFYHIDTCFEIADEINPQVGEYIIANNYFGIKDAYIRQLAEKYGDHLIVDCAQALFAEPISGIKTFYSTRKFVGVADGGVAFLGNIPDGWVSVREMECTFEHDSHLYKRKQQGAEAGFADYQANEVKLGNQPIRWMSDTTKQLLFHIDYDKIIVRRRENFGFLHEYLSKRNSLIIPNQDSYACPMVYPFVDRMGRNLRKELINNKVYIANYWPNVLRLLSYEWESEMAERILPLPIDQRYSRTEIHRIIEIINH